jgi:hypothetical protein
MKETKIDGFLLALIICLLITALFTVFAIDKDRREQEKIKYEREHFAPMQQGL